MRDKQIEAYLKKNQIFVCGMISSEKPMNCVALSEVLEQSVSEKYRLSPKACAGILRRAEKRGKTLPEHLAAALQAVADSEQISSLAVDCKLHTASRET